jgi:hypothetical protein
VGSGIEAGNKVGAQEAEYDGPVGVGRRLPSLTSRWRGGVSQLTWKSTRSATVSVAAQKGEASRPAQGAGKRYHWFGAGFGGKTTLSLGCQPIDATSQ